MQVRNLTSTSGKCVPNQFVISNGEETIFQSYNTNIVKIKNGEIFLDETYWDYSATTSKYRNSFLGETSAQTKAKIKSGEYTLTNLN